MLSSLNNSNSFWDDILRRPMGGWGLPLQLQRRGNFFSDSLFHDTRSHFDSAVSDIVRSFDFSRRDNDFASYRLLRDRHLTGTDRAASVTEEQDKFKVVMDVHGFIENDLKVTFLNDNELIVEGQLERKDESSFAKQSFKRRFLLPGKVIVNDAISSLTSDNILTITIPKQIQAISNTEANRTTITQSEQTSNLETQTGSALLNTQKSSQVQEQQSQSKMDTSFESALQNFTELPIMQRKDFFADSFFENVRNQFQNRVKEIMDKKFERTEMEDLNIYKKFREKEDKENSVAVTVSGDSKEHKIVLDVHGFSEGDLKVKAVSGNQLLVEGKVEKKTDNSYCNNSFRRTFYLPDVVDINQTTSALSSDGVLTILVPKQEKPLPIEYSIPITREEQIKKTSAAQRVLAKTTAASTQSKEHIVPIALGYKDDISSSTIQEEKKESCQFQSSPAQPMSAPPTQPGLVHKDNGNARMIPISLAGSFFQDSVFDTAKRKVETAVRDAMSRSTSIASQQSDITAQEQQQTTSLQQQTSVQQQSSTQQQQQASVQQQVSTQPEKIPTPKPVSSTCVDDVQFYKINLDVYGYRENELKIRTFPHNEICIEGNSETKKEGSLSKQSFQKRFMLPDYVLVDQASSALSSEGMLTVTMPKKQVQPLAPSEHIIPVSLEHQTPLLKDVVPQADIESCSASTLSDVSSVTTTKENQTTQGEYVLPLTMEKEVTKRSQQQEQEAKSLSSTSDSSSLSQQFIQRREEAFNKESLFDSDFFKDISTKTNFDLPIAPRGHFYQDSFFNDSRDMFESALRGTMSRFRNFSSFTDDMNFYKSLRDQRVAAETPTEASAEDQQFHKILLDVQGYKESDLKIQVLEGNGISAEGKVEEKGQGTLSTRSFKKCFFLPVGFNASEATTGLSADGVLTIKVPRSNKPSIAF